MAMQSYKEEKKGADLEVKPKQTETDARCWEYCWEQQITLKIQVVYN